MATAQSTWLRSRAFTARGGGVVGDAEMNAGVELVESGKPFQQDQMQSGFAGGNGDAAGFQTAIPADLVLTQPQLLKRSGSPPIKPQPLRRQGNTAVGADEELAAQALLQIVHAAGDIGLVITQYLRSSCKAFALGDIVKNAVIIVRYCQNVHLFAMLF